MLYAVATLIAAVTAHAATPGRPSSDACRRYQTSMPFIYKIFCEEAENEPPKTGTTNSTFAGGFNINPVAAPTEKTPWGVETIVSMIRRSQPPLHPDVAIIKGFHKIGTGIATAGNGTFYGNDVVRRASLSADLDRFSTETPRGHFADVNLGTSISLVSDEKATPLSLGLSARYNNTTNTVGGGTGLLLSPGIFSFGAGVSREKVSNDWPTLYFTSALVAARLGPLELEYDLLKHFGGTPLRPIHILTATLSAGPLILTGAARRVKYTREGYVTQHHFAVQLRLGVHYSVGYLYNYYPGANSFALQVYF